jgi:hypothetical protein
MILYYLNYKVNTSHILWIVKTSEFYEELLYHTRKFNSNVEKYYIIEREIPDKEKYLYELERRHFRQFKTTKDDTVLYVI